MRRRGSRPDGPRDECGTDRQDTGRSRGQNEYFRLNWAVRVGPPPRIDLTTRKFVVSRRSELVTPPTVLVGLLKFARFVTLNTSTYACSDRLLLNLNR